MRTLGSCPGAPRALGTCWSMYVLNVIFFSTNTINIYLISLTIYIVIPVSVCVGRAPRALLFPGYIILYKMVLTKGGYQKLSFEERQTMQWPKDSRSNLQINIQKTIYWETILWIETKEDTHCTFSGQCWLLIFFSLRKYKLS